MEVLSSFVKLNCVFILVQSSVQSWALFGSGFVLRSQLAGDTTVSIKRNKSNRFCWSSPGVKTAVWQLINVQFWHGWKVLLHYFSWFLSMIVPKSRLHSRQKSYYQHLTLSATVSAPLSTLGLSCCSLIGQPDSSLASDWPSPPAPALSLYPHNLNISQLE